MSLNSGKIILIFKEGLVMNKVKVLILFMCVMFVGWINRDRGIDNSTVGQIDVDSYLGTWYEIARLKNPVQSGLKGVTATYILKESGLMKLLSRGYDESNSMKEYEAVAEFLDDDTGKFTITYMRILKYDYFILEIDLEDYSYALIGNGDPSYLWVMSRSPQLSNDIVDMLLKIASQRGYDLDELQFVDQDINRIDD